MAGHSKWANIQHRKGAQDKKRAVLFSRLSKEITIAVKIGGGPDPDANPRLRLAIKNARGESMPKDNIKRAVDKGAGGGGADYVDVRYEGFGPGGVGIILESSTDNKNRAAGDIRSTFAKNGGNLGETGSVSFGFENLGEIVYPLDIGSEDDVMEAALEAGASDVETTDEVHVIYTEREELMAVAGVLEARYKDHEARSTKLIWKPQNTVPLDLEGAEKLAKLLDVFDELDDVRSVYDNSEIPDDVAEAMAED